MLSLHGKAALAYDLYQFKERKSSRHNPTDKPSYRGTNREAMDRMRSVMTMTGTEITNAVHALLLDALADQDKFLKALNNVRKGKK
jgi:hypothetical protein